MAELLFESVKQICLLSVVPQKQEVKHFMFNLCSIHRTWLNLCSCTWILQHDKAKFVFVHVDFAT